MSKMFCAVLLTSMIVASPANAGTIIDFDDINGVIPNGYNGLDWSNFAAANGQLSYPGTGYDNGTVSPDKIAVNGFGNPATISSTSPFIFNSGYFTSAWNNDMSVVVTGFVGGISTFSSTFGVSSVAPTFKAFGWANLSSVSFVGVGGTNAGYDGGGQQIAFDNLSFGNPVTGAVPEPATWAMMMFGFGMVGGAMRRRKSKVRATVNFA